MKKIFIIVFILPFVMTSQSNDKNYIKSITYQKGYTIDSISYATNNEKIETVSYFDDLGRPIQTVNQRAGGQEQDIIIHIEYDKFGRQIKNYLPYPSIDNGGLYRTDALTTTTTFYNTSKYENTENPFSQKILEASPLNRILNDAAPGEAWMKIEGCDCLDSQSDSYNTTFCANYRTTLCNSVPSGSCYCYFPNYYGYGSSECAAIRNANPLPPINNSGHTIKYEYKNNSDNISTSNYYCLDPNYYGYNSSECVAYRASYSNNPKYIASHFKVSLNLVGNTFMPTLINEGSYTSGLLSVKIVKDENWKSDQSSPKDHTTEEYKNKEDQIVLKRAYNEGVEHNTYYVHDDYGNLTYVLPPKVNTDDGVSQLELDELCYQYIYDQKNRLVEKKLPGKDWEYIVYDKLDRPILTQDGNLRKDINNNPINKWLFTKYDVFGRVAYTGDYKNSVQTSRTAMQALVDSHATLWETKLSSSSPINNTAVYYTNVAFPNINDTNINLYTINYYDDYTFDLDGGVSESSGSTIPSTNVKGLATGSKVRILGTNNWTTNVSYYDEKSRPIYNYSKNDYLNTIDKVKTELDFVGKITKTTTIHTRASVTTTIADVFIYDNAGRLLTQKQKINNQDDEIIVSNVYDELGQLKEKGVGGKATASNRLQTVDYTYNIRGWLKGINDVNAIGTDLFAFKINYNNPTDPTKALYNGNISQTFWKTASTDTNLKNYTYSYDALNRLTLAESQDLGRYNESMSYDKNGNIMSLIRNGNTNVEASTFGTMDNLVYSYNSNVGNKLMSVGDSSGITEGFKDGNTTGDDYSYDDNGNMTKDLNKGISTAITYNHLNLPKLITFATGNIEYVYDATGVKQRKIVSTGTTTDYAAGFIYENGSMKFFSHPEGYVANNSGTFDYIYQYKDHLGNVRLSYDKNLAIVEENNYYPFGLRQKGYNNNPNYSLGSPQAEKFKYNGKELQDELGLNFYDYGARNYDPALGRWMNVDPLAEKSRRFSPYTYALNNPVYFIDPDGMLAETFKHGDPGFADAWNELKRRSKNWEENKEESEEESEEGIDPPTTSSISDFFKSIFRNPTSSSEEEIEQSNVDRDFFEKVIDYWNKGNLKTLEYLATLMTLPVSSLEVGTTKGLVFFSGEGAEALALKQGYKTLGTTRAGINLQKLITSKNIPWSEAKLMWARLSATLAKSVPKGSTVKVFVNNPSAESIWLNVEKPILEKNGVKIIYTKL